VVDLAVLGLWLDSMMLRIFSNLNGSMILCEMLFSVLYYDVLRRSKCEQDQQD